MSHVVASLVASLLINAPLLAQPAPVPLPAAPPAQATAPPPATLPSFSSIFRDLGRDFRRLPSRETAWVLGGAGALSLAIQAKDGPITEHAVGSSSLDEFLDPGAVLGAGFTQFGFAIGTFLVGRASHNPRVATVGADLVRAQIVNTALTQGLKFAVHRTRPDGGRFSFPSGHSSSSFATAAVLQRHFGWKVGGPAYALAAYIGASRLTENRHYASDVIFGAAIGVVSGRTVTIGHGRSAFVVSPFAAPAGAGVSLTWAGAR